MTKASSEITENALRPRNYVMSQGDIVRVEHCPAARVYTGPKLPPHPAMWYGIFLHRFIEFGKTRGREAALRYVRSKRNKALIGVCERIDLDQIPDDAMFETGLVLDPNERTAELAPFNTAEHERHIFARSDMLLFTDLPEVVDFKSGPRSYDPATSVQLLTGAAGIAAVHNVDEVKVTVTNVLKTGELVPHSHVHKGKDLRAHWKRMRFALLLAQETRAELREEGAEPAFVPGEYCSGCKAEVACLYRQAREHSK